MKIAFLFPGQGAQKVGMGKDLYEDYEEVRNVFKKASEFSKIDIATLCFNGIRKEYTGEYTETEEIGEDLIKTENTQLAIATLSLAILEILKRKKETTIMKKRVLAVILGAVMTMSLAACGSSDAGKTSSNDSEKSYTIGISQFAEHGSLDNCREGFLEGLKEEGIEEGKNLTVEVKNAAADQGTAKQISDGFVSDKVDLVCAIATPSAQAAYNSAMNSDIPVVYTAVTDPVAAKLAKEDGTPAGNVTGTSDELPIKAQLEMIREMLPDAKNIGILYTTSEANSVSALAKYKELAGDYGFTIVDKGIAQTADISLATDELLTEVDCLTKQISITFRYSEVRSSR